MSERDDLELAEFWRTAVDPGIVPCAMHPDGVHPAYVDLAVCRVATRRDQVRTEQICAELRVAHLSRQVEAELAFARRRLLEVRGWRCG